MPYPQQPTGPAEAGNASGAAFGVAPSPSFPELEERVLEFWRRDDTFQESIRQREGAEEWVFNDGPPFANGLPHYGHLLTGYAKDVFPRFQTMRGKKVERRFGWDTHGLPAELEAMKQLGITEKAEIEEMGVAAFNAEARSSVLRYVDEWEDYVTRQARWVDFEHGYKTLNLGYMESVIWAFKQLYDKGLAYEGSRILPYCWRDETPLSNHELRMDDDVYQMRQDPSVTVTFPLEGDRANALGLSGVRALAWTTTPLNNMGVWAEGGPGDGADWRDIRVGLDDLEQKLLGRECYGGLDLARVNDLSAFVLLFPPTLDPALGVLAEKWIVLPRFWVPEEDILRRGKRDRVPYDTWRNQGFLVATPGNATDFGFIEAEIIALAGRYDLRELSYDRTFAGEIVQHLQDEGINLVQFGQGFLSMAAPTAELERLSVSRLLWHGGHPVLRWNASNVAVRHDPAGNIKPDKERSSERIDGIVAICNALGRALLRDVNAGRSVYDSRSILVL